MRLIDADALHIAIIEKGQANERGKYIVGDIWELTGAEIGEVIDFQPTINPEPHWIPVTERLPETTDAVLTTYIVNGDRNRRYVEESSYYGNDESWSSPWDEYRVAGTSIEVIAWMPLPEHYKGATT
jgi:hypothetical protein